VTFIVSKTPRCLLRPYTLARAILIKNDKLYIRSFLLGPGDCLYDRSFIDPVPDQLIKSTDWLQQLALTFTISFDQSAVKALLDPRRGSAGNLQSDSVKSHRHFVA
jgi:hypothetical protein